jgi:tellurite methyltransferase
MQRTIQGFHQDDDGDWVAALSCLHGQHVRHQPPFQDRAWVLHPEGREERIGGPIECPLCDRAELPEGLVLARTAGPFDQTTLPAGLRHSHRLADGTWACLRVLAGGLRLTFDTEPPRELHLEAPAAQPIPPGVPHSVSLNGPALVAVDFLVAP